MKVLVTLDGSGQSEAILPVLDTLAEGRTLAVTLLMVVDPPAQHRTTESEATRRGDFDAIPPQFDGVAGSIRSARNPTPGSFETSGQAYARVQDQGESYLSETAESLRARNHEVETAVLIDERPAEAIIDFIKSRGPDLVAMATHGRSGLSELVHGSVSASVVRAGLAPVVVLRPDPGA